MSDEDRPERPLADEPGMGAPLSREAARALLDRAAELVAAGDYADAATAYRRATGSDDPVVRGPALLGLGEALYRLDDDAAAVATWESILELPDNPATYTAWRNVAAARVRDADLNGAIAAYREADKRAPAADRAEIANRLGWLAKETGNTKAAGRYFARGRGAGPVFPLSWLIIGITVFVSFSAQASGGEGISQMLQLDKFAVAAGEYYRLWSVTLVHGGLIHLALNMYALFVVGPIVEQLYGYRLFTLFYLLCAAAGSVASFAFGSDLPSVGASGAIFGLFGIIFAAARAHHPMLDRQRRSLVGQVGMVIVLNIIIGFSLPRIDNMAHIGGLVAGLWLGLLFVPGRVATLSSLWRRAPDAERGRSFVLPVAGVAALVGVLVAGVVYGTDVRGGSQADLSIAAFRPIGPDWFDESRLDPESGYLEMFRDPSPVNDPNRARELAVGFARFTFGDVSIRVVGIDRGGIQTHCDIECDSLRIEGLGDVWAVTLDVRGSAADGRYRIALDPTIGVPVGVLEAVPAGG